MQVRIAMAGYGVLLVLCGVSCAPSRVAGPSAEKAGAASEAVGVGKLSAELLDQAIALTHQYAMNSQTERGTFIYLYDFVKGEVIRDDHEVRQAGSLWTLAILHQHAPSAESARGVARGLEFFRANSRLTPDGRRYIVYPGSTPGKTGAVALVALALIEVLRTEPEMAGRQQYERDLAQYLLFLRSLRMHDGHFCDEYDLERGLPAGGLSPFSDGEALLCMVTAAKYAGHPELKDPVLESAERMYWDYVARELATDPQSPMTKSFYQWGSMAFYEIYTSGWPDTRKYARRAIEMARWTIDVHSILSSENNTGSAYEGLVVAWELARLTGDRDAMEKIGRVIDLGLTRFISWQVGGPIPNEYLKSHPTTDPLAVGGVMNGAADPVLRVDVTMHQAHAMILARQFIYRR